MSNTDEVAEHGTLKSGDPWKASVSVACIRDTTLSQGARLLYANICGYMNSEQAAWPGMTRLAKDIGLSRRTIIRLIKELECAGYVDIERRYDPATRRYDSNVYTVWNEPRKRDTHDTSVTHDTTPSVTGVTRTIPSEPTHNNDTIGAERANGDARAPSSSNSDYQKILLMRGFGLDWGTKAQDIVATEYPNWFLMGWWLKTVADNAAGKVPDDAMTGHFIRQVESRVPPPNKYAPLAQLSPDAWAELVNCARAVHARTLCDGQPYEPPTHYLSELARAQWPLFARLFTTGEARASPQRHYALQNAELLWVLAKDAFAVETDDWLAEKRAQHEPAERETS